ncbi:hypothetical protein Ahy_B09g098076 [Arachis hypogaea]|uniref:ABC transporter C family member n=1 Tax=Arachis hypogaea TaxID=3818 RepID=A0A444XQI0_ARAHY|nr:hypothetical protein Ahy_B09g098076 [Arachis hypogaea]
MIIVAHRIPAFIDNDLVLVLDERTIMKYDEPDQLLQNNTSSFSNLMQTFLPNQELLLKLLDNINLKTPRAAF